MTSETQPIGANHSDQAISDDRRALTRRFTELYESHFDFVWRTLRYLGVPDAQVDDAVQDTFLVAHRRLEDFEARSSTRTWLFAIAMRVASDHRRSLRRKGRLLEAFAHVTPAASPTPLEDAVRNEARRALLLALEELSEEQRAVFVLADLEQVPSPEIARSLGLKLNTVYSRLRVARARIAELLRDAVRVGKQP